MTSKSTEEVRAETPHPNDEPGCAVGESEGSKVGLKLLIASYELEVAQNHLEPGG